jgi:hypothetical protein
LLSKCHSGSSIEIEIVKEIGIEIEIGVEIVVDLEIVRERVNKEREKVLVSFFSYLGRYSPPNIKIEATSKTVKGLGSKGFYET